ncbi:MAG: NAD-dependent epimerase/dehydratase family protein, partial [Actinomycetales bacterium]|nr:NAD-dependent epimerase/dehydratase family protein [Actinomycetales bacterium]
WDAIIDVCAYRPEEVVAVNAALGKSVGKYILISTVSVYDDSIPPLAQEDAPTTPTAELETLDTSTVPIMEHYGALKVLCELRATKLFPDCLIIRPTYVIGPDDYTGRFSAWVELIAKGGAVVAPEPKDSALQYIDARDLAKFTILATEQSLSGAFHVANPSGGIPFAQVLETIVAKVGGPDCTLNWMPIETALQTPEAFPLWTQGEMVGILQLDTTKALLAGLTSRDLADTVQDIHLQLGAIKN